MVLGFLTLGPGEVAVIAIIALVLFGPDKLPEIGKQIGMAYRELNRLRGDVHRALDIDELTRLELPDYSAPLDQTYSYHSSESTDSYAHEQTYTPTYQIEAPERPVLADPPGPPARFAMQTTHLNPPAETSIITESQA